MSYKKYFIVAIIVFTFVFVLPLAVASIVLGAVSPGKCDHKDKMGLDVGQYLLGLGIASCAICVGFIVGYMLVLFDSTMAAGMIVVMVLGILGALFSTAWFIVGGVILFRGNIDCIRSASVHVIYALVLWCLSAFSIVKSCITSALSSKLDS